MCVQLRAILCTLAEGLFTCREQLALQLPNTPSLFRGEGVHGRKATCVDLEYACYNLSPCLQLSSGKPFMVSLSLSRCF